jgi:hypothetical protein
VPNLLDQLKDRRGEARAAGDEILTRAAAEGRDPSPEELAEYQAHVTAERKPPTPWSKSATGNSPRSAPWPPATGSPP